MSDTKKDDFVIRTGVQVEGGELAVRINEEGVSAGAVKEFGPDTPEGTEVLQVEAHGPIGRVIGVSKVTGPAKCNSNDFRSGWDRIFGGNRQVAQA